MPAKALTNNNTLTTRGSERPADTPDLIPSYFARIDKGKLLTHEEEVDLSKRAKGGDRKARERRIERNLRLVVSVAKKCRGQGRPFGELIRGGKMGRMWGVERGAPER